MTSTSAGGRTTIYQHDMLNSGAVRDTIALGRLDLGVKAPSGRLLAGSRALLRAEAAQRSGWK